MSIEVTSAREAALVISTGETHVHWAPGDATLYRVALSSTVKYGVFDALSKEHDLTVLIVILGGSTRSLVLHAPRNGDELWTPTRFLRKFGPEYTGWWAGVRPLLAALGWTTAEHSLPDYDPNDAARIGALLEETV
jgi:hypothetical protein